MVQHIFEKIADDVQIMYDGRIVEHGPTQKIFSSPRDPYTIHLLECVPKGEPETKGERQPIISINNLQCHFPIKAGFFKRNYISEHCETWPVRTARACQRRPCCPRRPLVSALNRVDDIDEMDGHGRALNLSIISGITLSRAD